MCRNEAYAATRARRVRDGVTAPCTPGCWPGVCVVAAAAGLTSVRTTRAATEAKLNKERPAMPSARCRGLRPAVLKDDPPPGPGVLFRFFRLIDTVSPSGVRWVWLTRRPSRR